MNRERHTKTEDGSTDEIVVNGGAHLERLDGDIWFLEMKRSDGTSTVLRINGKMEHVEERNAVEQESEEGSEGN